MVLCLSRADSANSTFAESTEGRRKIELRFAGRNVSAEFGLIQ